METPNSQYSIAVKRLTALFAITYFAQGLSQTGGMIGQPLQFFLKNSLKMNAVQISTFLAIVTIPWLIKPVYGLITDCIPLFGYRRKTWLMTACLASSSGFLLLTVVENEKLILLSVLFASLGTAFGDVVVDALMVERGNTLKSTSKFQSTQWFWFNVACIITATAGGFLCSHFAANTALHSAALAALLAPLLVVVAAFILVDEQPVSGKTPFLENAIQTVLLLKNKALVLPLAFLSVWHCAPGIGIPLYFHMTDRLAFTQSYIGTLAAISGAGSLVGATLFGQVMSKWTLSQQLGFAVITNILGKMSYLFLLQPHGYSAILAGVLNFIFAVTGMVATLTALSLAALNCPASAEGITFALLMSVVSGLGQVSQITGAQLFTNVFASNLAPLLFIASLVKICSLLVFYLLKPKGESEEASD